MNQAPVDYREEIVAANWQQADELRRLRELEEARERRLRACEPDPASPPLRSMFGGGRGAVALLRGIPGFAAQWETVVPASFLRHTRDRSGAPWVVVSCVCGSHMALQIGELGECACERFFFHVGGSVRVKRFAAAA